MPARAHVGMAGSGSLFGGCFRHLRGFLRRLYVQQFRTATGFQRFMKKANCYSTVQRKLTIEWSLFRDPQRLGEIGLNQFGLAPPRPDQKVVMR